MLVDFGKSSLLTKAKNQPEKVKQVLNKIKTDGLFTTIDAVRSKLAQPIPLGYCNAGVVLESEVSEFQKGQRVVSNGSHAELVNIPGNLCAKIPDNVSDEEAAFTVVASIGLQGIRLAQPTIGEKFVVIGTGLIGLLTIQLLRAQGCKVMAVDLDDHKLKLAREYGATICNPSNGQDPEQFCARFTNSIGVDGVIITASTSSSEPVSQAARMCRKRGRIVLVGVTGLELNRSEFYEKELSFQVSCSYGPGRYDDKYELKGQDYPIGYVRWTEKRNFEAILDLFEGGFLNVEPLINHRIPFDDAPRAYSILAEEKNTLGIILNYEMSEGSAPTRTFSLKKNVPLSFSKTELPSVGFIGAGNYASRMLIPAFKKAGARLHTISSSGGTNASIHGRRNDFENATSDTERLLENSEINTVAIATRHNTHAKFVVQALEAGKHVFVEKPLAITLKEIEEIQTAYENAESCQVIVGFNRRFAPMIQKVSRLLDSVNEPKNFIMTVNAGSLPFDHWHYDREVGGGRIISEGCHFIDLLRYLSKAEIVSTKAISVGKNPAIKYQHDKVSITLSFSDGSLGTIFYLANGAPSFPKEQLDVFCAGRVLRLNNFKKLSGWGWPNFKKMSTFRQNKGQNEFVKAFIDGIEDGKPAIPFSELLEVSRVAIEASNQVEY